MGLLHMYTESRQSERGFTFIELMTTMTIIGVLSAVATSQFQAYAKRAFDSRAESDLRQILVAEEAYFANYETYVACDGAACELELEGVSLSPNVEISVTTRDDDMVFDIESFHPSGNNVFAFQSDEGKVIPSPRL